MALSAAEQQELSQLEGEVGHLAPRAAPSSGLSAAEQAELNQLEKEVGHLSVPKESSGFLDSALEKVAAVGKKINSYTGAPTRAAVSAAQSGNNPIPAFSKQFGEDPDTAPTGKDIALKAGVSDERKLSMTADQHRAFDEKYNPGLADAMKKSGKKYEEVKGPSPATAAGVGIELGADITNLIPAIGALKSLKAAEVAGEGAKVVSKTGVAESLAGKLKNFAEDTAVNATGATGVQASKFEEGAGRQLLDRKIVRFGDSQHKISERAAQAVEEANSQIDSTLSKLDAKGVKVDRNTIYNTVRDTITKMKADESKADIAKLLENELDNVVNAADAGGAEVKVSDAEKIKRGYNRKAGNWADPEKSMAGKEMYQTYRGAVEDAATAADPETAALFKEGKKSHGLLAPIQEAAERRASTTGQHQPGGFLDVVAAEVGEKALGPVGVVATPIARRILSPRLASSLAVTADQAADYLRKIPKFAEMEAKQPAMFGAAVSKLTSAGNIATSKAADEPPPQKGPAKWANDGYQNLLDHVQAGDDKKAIEASKEKLLASPAAKKLLIAASDLKPGSKAMSNLLERIYKLEEQK